MAQFMAKTIFEIQILKIASQNAQAW